MKEKEILNEAYRKEIRDKEEMAWKLREQALHEADGVADRIKAINDYEQQMAKQKAEE